MLNGKIEVTEDANKFSGRTGRWPEPGTLVVMPDIQKRCGENTFCVLEMVDEKVHHDRVEHRGLFWDKETAVMFAYSLIRFSALPLVETVRELTLDLLTKHGLSFEVKKKLDTILEFVDNEMELRGKEGLM